MLYYKSNHFGPQFLLLDFVRLFKRFLTNLLFYFKVKSILFNFKFPNISIIIHKPKYFIVINYVRLIF